MLISTFIMASWLLAVLFNLSKVINPEVSIFYPLRFSCSILVFWLGYYGLSNYSILTERIKLREEIVKDNSNKTRVIQNSEKPKSEKFQKIDNHIYDNLSYLNPNYSLEKLSSELKMSISLLSQIINSENENNFSDYINRLRIEKAKELLASPEFNHYTIISIGLECGFNSKSTFYLAFKKFTNTTPTEFRKKNSIEKPS
ncbi:helix-turn-helix domain-containing protein [Flavobacterium sp.]|uniref:helix-turn-helix domain-containing protein n=1 Tax=Flavobacterium sp. TaxID=239 RepID=UPI0040475D10